ncbi:alkaline phosphatase D family protein [Caulobacter henricii]|uniref:Alkaline phosphatase n=1 Tax=Caulobacter henricii TaxID=69395 RepID=A0A0P0NW68_9CAUL|nr:alkaline phosphatase D family protein [Caulobacter henricii]ALL12280.1 alkaline phosphatase [Caulobacter henricii]
MKIDRRKALAFLGLGGTAGAGSSVSAQALTPHKGAVAFEHGVASGDPGQTRVILWTRVTLKAPSGGDVLVELQVASDPDFKTLVQTRKGLTARPGADWTIKVDLDGPGLKPGTDYWYRFVAHGVTSPVGRTRTLPAGPTKDVVLAVASCSLYSNGYFNAYDAIARLPRVDAVLHLGDYIYEYGGEPKDYGMNSPVAAQRMPDPLHEIVSLDDYRRRHARYKSDPMLQAAHARAPWIVVWDDHETANDSWQGGAENHDPDKGEGDWAARKAAALKAYYEWMPIREPSAGTLPEASWRGFQFGDVATLLMTETRLTARSEQLSYATDLPIVDGKPDVAAFSAKWKDPARRLLGEAQAQWLAGQVKASVKAGSAWQVLGNQIVMARVAGPNLKTLLGDRFEPALAKLPASVRERVVQGVALSALGLPYNLDAWDGYPADRERLYDLFKSAGAHPIVLSGDSHSFWANELFDQGGSKRVAAEFGTTGITSPGYGDILPGIPLGQAFAARNPEVKFADPGAKGFVLLTLEHGRATSEMIAVSTILAPTYTTRVLKRFVVTPTGGGGVEALAEA